MNTKEVLNQRMTPPSLDEAIETGAVETKGLALVITPDSTWTIPGENQLASTTQMRLFEWAREHLFRQINTIVPFDTRTAHMEVDFYAEAKNNTSVMISPPKISLGNTSMTIEFYLSQGDQLCSRCKTVQVAVETHEDGSVIKRVIPQELRTLNDLNIFPQQTS